jgi:hypothetical protein
MLIIKIELWPFGDESLARTIAVGAIANDQTGTPKEGNYVSVFTDPRTKTTETTWCKGHPREHSVIELLRTLFNCAYQTKVKARTKPDKKLTDAMLKRIRPLLSK